MKEEIRRAGRTAKEEIRRAGRTAKEDDEKAQMLSHSSGKMIQGSSSFHLAISFLVHFCSKIYFHVDSKLTNIS